MFNTEHSKNYSKIKNEKKHMEKDVHSSTDSEGDDDRKYINQ
jgi:hypothetical protein